MSHRISKTHRSDPSSPHNTMNGGHIMMLQKYKFFYYQQHRHQGSTTGELNTIGVLSALEAKPASIQLNSPIHLMLGKRQWDIDPILPRPLAFLPLLGEHDGF
jgi:hypothetical protein